MMLRAYLKCLQRILDSDGDMPVRCKLTHDDVGAVYPPRVIAQPLGTKNYVLINAPKQQAHAD